MKSVHTFSVPHEHVSNSSAETACKVCGESVGHANHHFDPRQRDAVIAPSEQVR